MYIIIGAGTIAVEYFRILKDTNVNVKVIGRGQTSADAFFSKTGCVVNLKSLEDFLMSNAEPVDGVIVAVNVESLYPVIMECIRFGIKKIMVEKPGAITSKQLNEIALYADLNNVKIFIAYNRRNYSSTIEAKKLIEIDGGVKSYRFEITEWGHQISRLDKKDEVLNNWFLANTSHVVDLAFYLCGRPRELNSICSQPTEWHPSGTNFCGSGVTENGALLVYFGNWLSPGRWGVEIQTEYHKIILCPLETLKIQKIGSLLVEEIKVDNELDIQYKPGFYLQVKSFVCEEFSHLCTIEEHLLNCRWYDQIAGYAN